ncbi:MAG: metallopeptidase [Kiritimatiellae bacterium]|nr:metallopeptidase [Kiritimatiellia bacterium]
MSSVGLALTIAVGWCIAAVGHSAEVPIDRAAPLAHVVTNLEGWQVRVDVRLLDGSSAELGRRALALLQNRLLSVALVVPTDKLVRLRGIPIQLDLHHGRMRAMGYHPSAEWLRQNGYDTNLAGCVHIPDAAAFLEPEHYVKQPWAILHELAHAVHHQVLSHEHPGIRAAWERVRAAGRWERCLHIYGHDARHYALTSPQEFFAEMTEAYFGVNDFFPFNRGELRRYEPDIHQLMEDIWERPWPEPAADP